MISIPLFLLILIYRKDFVRASIGQGSVSQRTTTDTSNNDNSVFSQFNGNFLLDEEGANPSLSSSSYVCRYLQMHTDDDKFPTLVRRESGQLPWNGNLFFMID